MKGTTAAKVAESLGTIFRKEGFTVAVEDDDDAPGIFTAQRRFEPSILYGKNKWESTVFTAYLKESKELVQVTVKFMSMMSDTKPDGYKRLEDFQGEQYKKWLETRIKELDTKCQLRL